MVFRYPFRSELEEARYLGDQEGDERQRRRDGQIARGRASPGDQPQEVHGEDEEEHGQDQRHEALVSVPDVLLAQIVAQEDDDGLDGVRQPLRCPIDALRHDGPRRRQDRHAGDRGGQQQQHDVLGGREIHLEAGNRYRVPLGEPHRSDKGQLIRVRVEDVVGQHLAEVELAAVLLWSRAEQGQGCACHLADGTATEAVRRYSISDSATARPIVKPPRATTKGSGSRPPGGDHGHNPTQEYGDPRREAGRECGQEPVGPGSPPAQHEGGGKLRREGQRPSSEGGAPGTLAAQEEGTQCDDRHQSYGGADEVERRPQGAASPSWRSLDELSACCAGRIDWGLRGCAALAHRLAAPPAMPRTAPPMPRRGVVPSHPSSASPAQPKANDRERPGHPKGRLAVWTNGRVHASPAGAEMFHAVSSGPHGAPTPDAVPE